MTDDRARTLTGAVESLLRHYESFDALAHTARGDDLAQFLQIPRLSYCREADTQRLTSVDSIFACDPRNLLQLLEAR